MIDAFTASDQTLDQVIHPVIFYLACALGAVGVAMALPRRGPTPRVFGGLAAAIAGGLVMLGFALRAGGGDGGAGGELPGFFFYVFAVLALGAGLRMITHHRPVYSALYFILTIVASAGLYVLLSAEFMAFALIIIYAGAILITYLFVIMLATQAPVADDEDALSDYDVQSREPWMAALTGFVLLGLISTMLFRGAGALPRAPEVTGNEALAELPRKVERALRRAPGGAEPDGGAGLIAADETLRRVGENRADIDLVARTAVVEGPGGTRVVGLPETLVSTNVEEVGINLLRDHPMTIEIAGVILLMAMLGATVLARKQVELEEALKAAQQRLLGDTMRARGEDG